MFEIQKNKLPEITLGFWIMKISATTMGETGGDWLSMTMKLGYLASTGVFLGILAVLLCGQLSAKRHIPLLYWAVITATSTAGTTFSDYLDRTAHLGYLAGSSLLLLALIAVLSTWRFSVGTISVENIETKKAELFYWAAVLISNTLGTALGDFLADSSGLGFFKSWLLITTSLSAILILRFSTKLSAVALFWFAFVLTRPFGATFGDVLTKAKDVGGLDLGTGLASLCLAMILLVAIAVCYRKKPGKGWILIH